MSKESSLQKLLVGFPLGAVPKATEPLTQIETGMTRQPFPAPTTGSAVPLPLSTKLICHVAEAVHKAVCEFTGTDGCNRCLHYSLAGAALLGNVTGRSFIPQAGTLRVFAEPPDGWLEIDVLHDGDPQSGLARGEYHCWIAGRTGTEAGWQVGTMIDLTSRHYRRVVEASTCGGSLTWARPDPPKFLLIEGGVLHEWVRLRPEPFATSAVLQALVDHADYWRPLLRLAAANYRGLVEAEAQRRERQHRRDARRAVRRRKKASRW